MLLHLFHGYCLHTMGITDVGKVKLVQYKPLVIVTGIRWNAQAVKMMHEADIVHMTVAIIIPELCNYTVKNAIM